MSNYAKKALQGRKDDDEKARMDLLPADVLLEVGKRLKVGADKYSDRNWELGMDWGRPYAALMRHALAWWGGELEDPETGQDHMIAVICNAIFLYEYAKHGLGEDTRGL